MKKLSLGLFQYDIIANDIQANLDHINSTLAKQQTLPAVVILPEMCATGFDFSDLSLAQDSQGTLISALCQLSKSYRIALIGSFLCLEQNKYYNRAFFIDQDQVAFYDKRHLFCMSDESKLLEPGEKMTVINYQGWKIALQICYDLRFPVFARNKQGDDYDLLVYIANWPRSRQKVWHTLLMARAIENNCYVAGCNRIGTDSLGISYRGGSQVISMRGEVLCECTDSQECLTLIELDQEALHQFRDRFPVWKDADCFDLQEPQGIL